MFVHKSFVTSVQTYTQAFTYKLTYIFGSTLYEKLVLWTVFGTDKYIAIVKPTRCNSFSNYSFLHNTLHVSDGLSVHHQEFKTVHTATGIYQTDTAACC
jgi:hypothetical protein